MCAAVIRLVFFWYGCLPGQASPSIVEERLQGLPSLEDAIREAVLPHLQNSSRDYNHSSWGFFYRDASTHVGICAGYSDLEKQTPCSTNDMYAWGSTTKTQTSLSVLQLADKGELGLSDTLVEHADKYFQSISGGVTLESLFGPLINNVTIRHLLQMHSGIQEYDNKATREYQNTHRDEDLGPVWVLNFTNRTFECAPGTCAHYSSTNYVLLGLVLANHANASSWDRFDQRSWIPASSSSSFPNMYYPVHGQCRNFTSATGTDNHSTMHGYQTNWGLSWNESDVYDMSCTQGWTCGNLVAPTADVAEFFWTLLGPPSQGANAMLKESTLKEMLTFKSDTYFDSSTFFGYGLGMMNFTSMDWGFADGGAFHGHNGLTYGFGAQSGYNYDLEFAVTWVNNYEHWIGPDAGGEQNALYAALVDVVKRYRAREPRRVYV